MTVAKRRSRTRTLHKADAKPAAQQEATFTPQQALAIAQALAGKDAMTGTMTPLPRTQALNALPFSPGVPLVPSAINPLRPDSGRPEPRAYEFPITANLPGGNERLVPWSVLRQAADGVSMFRKCIEVRKDEVATLEWDIVISKKAIEREARTSGGMSRADLQKAMQERLEPEIGRLVDWWEEPDRRNGLDWIDWAKKALEERFVLDGLAIYPRHTFGGDLYSLEILDGSTIKPLLDEYGGRPLPPSAAYQQILWGFPRGEFIADLGEDGLPTDAYPSDQLIYDVDNVRSWTPYGFSAVERALIDGALFVQRNQWMLSEYTDGVMPSGWLIAGEGQADWTADQLREYEQLLNDYYSGLTANRQRLRILPYGMQPHDSPNQAEKYKPDYDLHLIKLVAGHFDTTLAELGFTEPGGLGSKGWHEGQAKVQDRKATGPTIAALQSLITKLSRRHLRMPRELQFKIIGLEQDDENLEDEIADRQIRSGRKTLNEDRDRLGLARFQFEEADKPFIVTGTGPVFIEGAQAAAEAVQQQQAAIASAKTNPSDGQGGDGQPGDNPAAGDSSDGQPSGLAKAEIAAYRRWAKKGGGSRPFRFEHASPPDLAGEALKNVEFIDLAKADAPEDSTPAAPDRRWPAWEVDQQLAAAHTTAIMTALAAGLTRGAAVKLATDWLAAAGPGASAAAWLHTQDLDVAGPLADVLNDLYTEAVLAGDRSADAVLTHGFPLDGIDLQGGWDNWTPGDPEAARQLLSADGREVRLQHLLDRFGITIKSIAHNRLDDLAAVLADGLQEGRTPDEIGKAIRTLVTDRKKAYQIAITETNRALSAAAVAEYEASGVRGKGWMNAADQDVCQICRDNEDAGPIPIGDLFPSKDPFPPAHPHCRCAIVPDDLEPVDELTKAWDPGKHPRGPGGKFRSIGARLQDALDDHRRNGGKGDPFKDFNREQLRRAARARGITLSRGEDHASISKKIADDMQKGNAPTPPVPAAAPAVRTPSKPNARAVQDAKDVIHATGVRQTTAMLGTYGKLRKLDFAQLDAADQSALLGDLHSITQLNNAAHTGEAHKLIKRFAPAGTHAGIVPKQPILPPANAILGQHRVSDPLGTPGLLKVSTNPGQSGDGWFRLPGGGTGPWGQYGAAGILLRHQGADGKDRYLIVQRGPGISDPGKWQFPGGAIDSNETAYEGGTREVLEELGFNSADLAAARVHGTHEVSIPGGWKYTSIAATVPTQLQPNLSTHHARMETADAKWMTIEEIDALDKQGKMLKPLANGQLNTNVITLFPNTGPRSAVPAAPKLAHKPSKGRNLLADKAAIDKLRQDVKQARSAYAGKSGDDRLAAIGAMQGFDDTPTVVSKKEMDRLLATGDYVEAWRGVNGNGWKTAAQMHEDMRSGPAFYGRGVFGNGYYLATQKSVAQQYSDGSKGSTMRVLIPKSAAVDNHQNVVREAHAIASPRSKAKGTHEDGTLWDEGRYAAAKGLDGVIVDHKAVPGSGSGQSTHVAAPSKPAYNWLNRSVLIIQEA